MGSALVPFSRTYDEALAMTVEARNYMAHGSVSRDFRRLRTNASPDLKVCCEALRVTSRLTQVMAWLMLQRAVQDGEISAEEACGEHNRLAGHDVCLDTAGEEDDSLPEGLRSLLDRSYRLYRRVSRLEGRLLAHWTDNNSLQ